MCCAGKPKDNEMATFFYVYRRKIISLRMVKMRKSYVLPMQMEYELDAEGSELLLYTNPEIMTTMKLILALGNHKKMK